MTNDRTILDIKEEQIVFINTFLIEQCLKIEPELDIENLGRSGKLLGIQLPNETYQYFYNKKIPLLYVDLKLLIDGT